MATASKTQQDKQMNFLQNQFHSSVNAVVSPYPETFLETPPRMHADVCLLP
jgi:hypothetical protein